MYDIFLDISHTSDQSASFIGQYDWSEEWKDIRHSMPQHSELFPHDD